jgi:hypothetical protein
MKKTYIFAFIIVFISIKIFADEEPIKINCEYSVGVLDNFQTQFKSLKELSANVGPILCKHALLVDTEDVEGFEQALFNYAKLSKTTIQSTYPESLFPGVNAITEQWENQLKNYALKLDYLNPISFFSDETKRDADGNKQFILRVKLPPENQNNLSWALGQAQENKCKETSYGMGCREASDNLESAINPAFILLNNVIAEKNGKLLGKLQTDWKNFIKEARYQTPLDVWATTTVQPNKFNGSDLVGPPEVQLFLLRPSIVFEHVNELEKGDKDDVSLAIEWAGMNWWQNGFGFSLTSIYNDRKEADAVGHGLTLHIKNKYSFGYVHRKDDNGSFFFNIDLLEFFGENKDVYKQYKQHL